MSDTLNSKRYEPLYIDLENENNSQAWIIRLTGQNKNVLEVGTSTGYVSKILRDNGNSVTGIEIDGDAGKIAGQYCEKMIIGDIENIDLDECLGDSRFDVIIFGDVLEHIKYPQQVLEKIKRFIISGGYLIVSLPNACHGDVIIRLMEGDFRYTPKGLLDFTHLRFFGLKNTVMLFNECGYSIQDMHKIIVPMGSTEQEIEPDKISEELFKFINLLPDTNVYQFVFKAFPGNGKIVIPDAAPVGQIFDNVIEDTVKERTDYLEREIATSNASYQEQIKDLEIKIEDQIRESNARYMNINRELQDMKRSIVWQFLMKFQHEVIDRFFPQGKKRRLAYDLMLRGGRVLINEGPEAFFYKSKEYINYKKRVSGLSDYNRWILKNEPTTSKLKQYSMDSKNFLFRPKISIITPVYNPDVAWIKSAIDSVLHQSYDNWELCLVDASTREDVKNFLKKYTRKDPRIKIKFLTKNKGISGNTNEALSLTTGEYIGLLDHDDELSPDALFEVVKYLQDNPEIDMIYSDEDKIDLKGMRSDPYFKPDWSPDMFLSCMYTCHFGVYRKKIIDEIGGFREGYDGSQDYDLVLRFIEKTNKIYHIPKILYHWKTTSNSTAASMDNKKYARDSAKKALKEYMLRNKIDGNVEDGVWSTSYRVRRTIQGNPLISIIIPTKDKSDVLKRCLDSIISKTDYSNYEIIIVNNRSEEQNTYHYFEKLRLNEKIRVFDYNKEFNFSAINNFAVSKANGEILLFLNNDIEVINNDWLSTMVEHAQRDDVGAVGCKLIYPNNTIQHAGVILGINGGTEKGVAGHSHKYLPASEHGYFGRADIIQNLSAVTAACMMMRKEVFDELGGFDENLVVAFNDIELCLRIRQHGYLIVYTPFASLYHYESLSRGHENTPEKQERFNREIKFVREKWGNVIEAGDPYYNPNLSLKHENYQIKIY